MAVAASVAGPVVDPVRVHASAAQSAAQQSGERICSRGPVVGGPGWPRLIGPRRSHPHDQCGVSGGCRDDSVRRRVPSQHRPAPPVVVVVVRCAGWWSVCCLCADCALNCSRRGLRGDQNAIHTQPQRRPVMGQRHMSPHIDRTTRRTTYERDTTADRPSTGREWFAPELAIRDHLGLRQHLAGTLPVQEDLIMLEELGSSWLAARRVVLSRYDPNPRRADRVGSGGDDARETSQAEPILPRLGSRAGRRVGSHHVEDGFSRPG